MVQVGDTRTARQKSTAPCFLPQIGDVVEIARLPAGLRWVVVGPHPQDDRRWRVQREFSGGRIQGRNVGVGDLQVVGHPTFEPGQTVRYFGSKAKVLADHGDTVAIKYLYLRPRNLDRRNGVMRVPTVDTGMISVARADLLVENMDLGEERE